MGRTSGQHTHLRGRARLARDYRVAVEARTFRHRVGVAPMHRFFTREDGHGASGLGAGHLDRRRGEGDNCVPEAARVVHREPAWAARGSS